jgi:hypothetical protein
MSGRGARTGGYERLARKAPEIPGEPEPVEDRLIALPRAWPPVRSASPPGSLRRARRGRLSSGKSKPCVATVTVSAPSSVPAMGLTGFPGRAAELVPGRLAAEAQGDQYSRKVQQPTGSGRTWMPATLRS